MNTLLDIVKKENIRRYASSTLYSQGQQLLREGQIYLISIDNSVAQLLVVDDGQEYNVEFQLYDDGLGFECQCPPFYKNGLCRHIVGAHLFLQQVDPDEALAEPDFEGDDGEDETAPEDDAPPLTLGPAWRQQVDNALELAFEQQEIRESNSAERAPYLLYFSLQTRSQRRVLLAYKLMADQLPETLYDQETAQLIGPPFAVQSYIETHSAQLGLKAEIGTYTDLAPDRCLNRSDGLLAMLAVGQKTHQISTSTLVLNPFLREIALLGGEIFVGSRREPLQTRIAVQLEPAEIGFELTRLKTRLKVVPQLWIDADTALPLPPAKAVLDAKQVWLILDDQLVYLKEETARAALSLARGIGNMTLPHTEADYFLEHYLLPMLELVKITGEGISWVNVEDHEPKTQLYLHEVDDGESLIAEIAFGYEGYSIPYIPSSEPGTVTQRDSRAASGITFARIKRQPALEQAAYGTVSKAAYGLKHSGDRYGPEMFELRSNSDPLDFLLNRIPVLIENGFEIYGEENLSMARVNRLPPTMHIRVHSDEEWYDVKAEVNFGDVGARLRDIRRAVERKDRFVRLADGSIGEIPDGWLNRYRHLFTLGEQHPGGMRFDIHHLTMLDQVLSRADEVEIDESYMSRLDRLRTFDGIRSVELPDLFHGELRPYQKAGYDWLHFLQEFNFGGCLADDMGLGKTVQMLAFLASMREFSYLGDETPAELIIMPRSLLINWEREAAKFTPELEVLIHFGPKRTADPTLFDSYDLVLTTYGVMRQDVDMLESYRFNSIVLDESQVIKNPAAQISKAVRRLPSERRITMSGTPVENSTFELWSQFAFLNPGLLGSLEQFRREFGNPIEKEDRKETARFLKGMIFPFILRRTKQQVATDLPPRTDEIIYTEMDPVQARIYEETREQYQSKLMGLVEERGVQGARMKVLEGLLRLRQICNHPKLVHDRYRGASAKMDLLLDQMETIAGSTEGGRPHKALIFSQFVQMLKLIGKELDQRGIRYAYLDGQTKYRQAAVDAFQTDRQIPFFLISLKAGGVGLNLTKADYVIHVDPWWNPAAEMQATDRAHRIGQENPVFVYKLITRNSVEERILEMQQKKQALVEQLITTESGFFKTLSAEDIQILFS